ncbi:MAG: FKBP-type peptidyl-prolyl cis-trans isomerase N-terminal domain-containing protein [Bacteroidota bacterium]|jgi:FKBP-type peptidyl-prolyl cis-trans isomerase
MRRLKREKQNFTAFKIEQKTMKKQIIYLPVMALGLLAGCGESIDTSKELKTSEDSFSYVYGYETAQRMKQQGIDGIDFGSFLRGVKDGMAKDSGYAIKQDAMGKVYQGYVQGVQDKKIKVLQKETNDFMAKVSKEAGVSPLASKGYYKELKKGNGAIPGIYDTVSFFFKFKNAKGKVIQDNSKEGKPAIGNVASLNLAPLEEAFQKTSAGGSFAIYLSNVEFPNLARMAGSFDDMYGVTVIEVEMLSVVPGKKPSNEPPLDYIPPPAK